MADRKVSIKHLQVDKANRAVIAATAVAVAVLVFGLFMGRALLVRQGYQGRVIKKKEQARAVLNANKEAKDSIVAAYKVFTGEQTNLIGGSVSSEDSKGGDNARLILDALPSKYDFPALVTSIEKLLNDNEYVYEAITGSDDEANQPKEAQDNPEPVEIPFGVSLKEVPGERGQDLLRLFETSIRPFKFVTIDLTVGDEGSLNFELSGVTFYQPEKALTITKEVVK